MLILRFSTQGFQPLKHFFIILGIFLGLSALSKVTTFLLVTSIIIFILITLLSNNAWNRRFASALTIKNIFIVVGLFSLISGWYYFRNMLEMGHFFIGGNQFYIGGHEAINSFEWWQDPGFRTLRQFFVFGEALLYPIYSITGIWDSLYSTMWIDGFLSGITDYAYRPPWNYSLLLSSIWLSLVPAAAIIIGGVSSLRRPQTSFQQGTLFPVICVFVYISAIFYLFLSVPIYSIAKAKYTLGLIPCHAVLCVKGLDLSLIHI